MQSTAANEDKANKIQDTHATHIKRALLSVSNKDGLEALAKHLHQRGVEILSTGGTYKALESLGIPAREVSDYTNFPEIMDGRVKTLHPAIHGGILAKRDNDDHQNAMQSHDIAPIDLVVVNLYPFVETIKTTDNYQTCIENIDIGGPALIRAAAKNHEFITVITDPQDYAVLLEDMDKHDGATSFALRKKLAETAYARTAAYDAAIAGWMTQQTDTHYPRRLGFFGDLKQILRYGENPHQTAALYRDDSERPGVTNAEQIQGKDLSFNNINDTNAAFELVSEFESPSVVIVKHANPCGVASAKTLDQAYKAALRCDPVSAFGGIIAVNSELDAKTAENIINIFSEVIIAPAITDEARQILAEKQKLRVLISGTMPSPSDNIYDIKTISGGFLVQDKDNGIITPDELKVVTDREPTDEEMRDLLFAFKVCKHVKSNAIVYAKNHATVGIGAGQMSRVDSTRIAAHKAQIAATEAGLEDSLTKGSVVASDAFFPFSDGLITAAEAGATAIIQPGGSIRDKEVIEAANDRGLAMVFTDIRHFKH